MLPDDPTALALSLGPPAYGLIMGLCFAAILAMLYQRERLYVGLFTAFAILALLGSVLRSLELVIVVNVSEPEILALYYNGALPVLLAVLPPVLTCIRMFPVPQSGSAQSHAGAIGENGSGHRRCRCLSRARPSGRLHHARPADNALTARPAPERNG